MSNDITLQRAKAIAACKIVDLQPVTFHSLPDRIPDKNRYKNCYIFLDKNNHHLGLFCSGHYVAVDKATGEVFRFSG